MAKTPLHFRNIRLRNNAGMDFPECYAHAKLLDLDKTALPTTGDQAKVTCKNCLRNIKGQWFDQNKSINSLPRVTR